MAKRRRSGSIDHHKDNGKVGLGGEPLGRAGGPAAHTAAPLGGSRTIICRRRRRRSRRGATSSRRLLAATAKLALAQYVVARAREARQRTWKQDKPGIPRLRHVGDRPPQVASNQGDLGTASGPDVRTSIYRPGDNSPQQRDRLGIPTPVKMNRIFPIAPGDQLGLDEAGHHILPGRTARSLSMSMARCASSSRIPPQRFLYTWTPQRHRWPKPYLENNQLAKGIDPEDRKSLWKRPQCRPSALRVRLRLRRRRPTPRQRSHQRISRPVGRQQFSGPPPTARNASSSHSDR